MFSTPRINNMELEIRKLHNDMIDLLEESAAPMEAKRILLLMLAKHFELGANERIKVEIEAQKTMETITEKGELQDESNSETD